SHHEDSLAVGTQQVPSKPSAILGPWSPKPQNWAPVPALPSCKVSGASRQASCPATNLQLSSGGWQRNTSSSEPGSIPASNICRLDPKQPPSRTDGILSAQAYFGLYHGQGAQQAAAWVVPVARSHWASEIWEGKGAPWAPSLDLDPLPVTLLPSCQDDLSAPHSHGPQSREDPISKSDHTVRFLVHLVHTTEPSTEGKGESRGSGLAGALDISSCPQTRKNVLFDKAREAFASASTSDTYYRFMRPYLGGAPVEELRHLAQANVSMDIDTFTNLNPRVLQVYPGGVPEEQLRLIPSLLYLYSLSEIGQWHITSKDTVVTLLAPDGALENQTEAILQKFLDHNGTVTGALLMAIGGSRLCWMSPRQIQDIRPSEFRVLGGPQPRLSASDLLLLGVLVCDMDASSIVAADPHVLQNLQHCPRLTAAQQAALNRLLASGRTILGPWGTQRPGVGVSTGQALGTALGEGKWPDGSRRCSETDSEPPLHTRPPSSWNLERLRALGRLASYISPGLWMQVKEPVQP
ncbi:PREDICTED: mesothelin-like protein, partial [Bison bison bison]|uniref:Mesothelin-like protein n=1 Tax=Bison bison bison TaxID=43346 RepID=A0A6P3HLR6_BISBB